MQLTNNAANCAAEDKGGGTRARAHTRVWQCARVWHDWAKPTVLHCSIGGWHADCVKLTRAHHHSCAFVRACRGAHDDEAEV